MTAAVTHVLGSLVLLVWMPFAFKEKIVMTPQATLEAHVRNEPARLDEEIKLEVVLKNTGADPLWVNQRMLVNNGVSLRKLRELWFEVTGPDKQPLPFMAKVRAGEAEPRHYRVLKSGGEVRTEVVLSRYFRLNQAGTYTIVAHYQDSNEAPPKTAPGTTLLSEPLRTQPIRLEVR